MTERESRPTNGGAATLTTATYVPTKVPPGGTGYAPLPDDSELDAKAYHRAGWEALDLANDIARGAAGNLPPVIREALRSGDESRAQWVAALAKLHEVNLAAGRYLDSDGTEFSVEDHLSEISTQLEGLNSRLHKAGRYLGWW